MSDFALPPPPDPDPPPFAALAYAVSSTPAAVSRPGLLTAIGTVSIFTACVSLIACVGTMPFVVLFHLTAKAVDATAAASRPPPPLPAFLAPVAPTAPVLEEGPDGLTRVQRFTAASAIYSIHPLRPPRAEQLDAILARAGRRILGVQGNGPIEAQWVRAAVIDHGELFGGSRKAAPPEYFKTASGRLEVFDDRAVFYPEDGSAPVRSSTIPASAPRPLTPEQVRAVVEQVRSAPGGAGLNAAQASGLAAVLGLPNQRLAQAAAGLNAEPRAVTVYRDGAATVRFTGGELRLGVDGKMLTDPPDPASLKPPAANLVGVVLVGVGVSLNACLAVLLLVAGIAVVRDRTGRGAGRRLHVMWAVMKIPLAALTAAALWWVLDGFSAAVDTLPPGASLPAGRAGLARSAPAVGQLIVGAGLLSCLYPVALLAALKAKRVREYYRPGAQEA